MPLSAGFPSTWKAEITGEEVNEMIEKLSRLQRRLHLDGVISVLHYCSRQRLVVVGVVVVVAGLEVTVVVVVVA